MFAFARRGPVARPFAPLPTESPIERFFSLLVEISLNRLSIVMLRQSKSIEPVRENVGRATIYLVLILFENCLRHDFLSLRDRFLFTIFHDYGKILIDRVKILIVPCNESFRNFKINTFSNLYPYIRYIHYSNKFNRSKRFQHLKKYYYFLFIFIYVIWPSLTLFNYDH